MERKIKNYREPVPPLGFIKKNIFLKPKFGNQIATLAKLRGVHKYQILDGFFEAYWKRFEKAINKSIEKALEELKAEMGEEGREE